MTPFKLVVAVLGFRFDRQVGKNMKLMKKKMVLITVACALGFLAIGVVPARDAKHKSRAGSEAGNEIILAASSPFEDMTEAALAADRKGIERALQAYDALAWFVSAAQSEKVLVKKPLSIYPAQPANIFFLRSAKNIDYVKIYRYKKDGQEGWESLPFFYDEGLGHYKITLDIREISRINYMRVGNMSRCCFSGGNLRSHPPACGSSPSMAIRDDYQGCFGFSMDIYCPYTSGQEVRFVPSNPDNPKIWKGARFWMGDVDGTFTSFEMVVIDQ